MIVKKYRYAPALLASLCVVCHPAGAVDVGEDIGVWGDRKTVSVPSVLVSPTLESHWRGVQGVHDGGHDFGLAASYRHTERGGEHSRSSYLSGILSLPAVSFQITDQWSYGLSVPAVYGPLSAEHEIEPAPFHLTEPLDVSRDVNEALWHQEAYIETHEGLPPLAAMPGEQIQTVGLGWQSQPMQSHWLGRVTLREPSDSFSTVTKVRTGNDQAQDTSPLTWETQYQAGAKWFWNTRFTYDANAMASESNASNTPSGESLRLATGASYALGKNTDINVSWALVRVGDMVEQAKTASESRTSAELDHAWIQALSGHITSSF
jgi:long-chain fatty acid transport protein